jgi:protein of unknown function (DUF1822)
MVTEQETLIYIEEQDKLDASAAANAFAHKDTRNRAYINTLGAELALKYLASENVDVSNTYNIHSIKKILEEMDISDVMLPNIHIDVRVVFDENVIFIPKAHFEYNLVPDIYLVFNLAKDFSHVKFLGFFEPKLINKNNANDKYYFIEKEKLNSAVDLKKYIETFNGNTKDIISQEELENSERIIIAMADNDISEDDKKYLIKQLTKSADLRDKFIEYENFETLSYKAMTSPDIHRKAASKKTDESLLIDGLANLENIEIQDEVPAVTSTEEAPQMPDAIADELNLEPINDIAFDEQPAEVNKDAQDSNTFMSETGSLLAESAAAGLAAAAAGETAKAFETAETSLNIVDSTLDIVDTGIEFAKDLITDEVTSSEPISLDDIDTSALDNINLSDDKIEEETISLGDVKIPEDSENTDFIEQIDNKISFDDIQTDNLIDEPAPLNIDEETISLNDIDTSDIHEETEAESYEEETLSFDNIDTSNLDNSVDIDESLLDNTISFNDINIDDEKESSALSGTDIETPVLSFDNIEEPVIDDVNNDFMDNSISLDEPIGETLDEFTETSEINNDDLNNAKFTEDHLETVEDITLEPLEETLPETEVIEDEIDVIDATDEVPKNESFGKNLLENLSEENIDDIAIEDLGLDDSIADSAENISSADLLSQIDNILNSAEVPETTIQEIQQEENITQPQEEITSFDSIPDISDLESVNDILSDNVPVNEEQENTLTEEIQGISELSNDMPDTGIDELLNFDDSFAPSNEENDLPSGEDNIGVLFNDTDPVSDAELDAIDVNQMPYEQNFTEQQVPGAALLNKKSQPNKKTIIVAAALVTVLAAASAFVIFKPKNDNSADIEPLAPVGNTENVNKTETPTLPSETTENILATNAPEITKTAAKEIQKAQPAKELKSIQAKQPKQASSESYLSINRLVWDVPGTLSYSTKMQNYLRTAGKSIKLSLSADLLLATEYAYTNQVKVNLKLSKNGNVQDAKIASSSGSTQIDNIVLQSVKDTLNVVKPPSSEIKTQDFNLSLIIYF